MTEEERQAYVLVCGIKFRAGLFVSCDEQREVRWPNHLQI